MGNHSTEPRVPLVEAVDEELTALCDTIIGARGSPDEALDALRRLQEVGHRRMRWNRVDVTGLARLAFERVLLELEVSPVPALEVTPGMQVPGDPVLLRTLLEHLLHNAVKFTHGMPDPRIVVEMAEHVGSRVLTVRDNGVGFAPEDAEAIFRPLRHGIGVYGEGSGVGLAVVRRVAHRHGGRVWAEGSAGGGAAFHVSFPDETAGR